MSNELYSLSDDLIKQSIEFVRLLNTKIELQVKLHETITLPDYGQRVILRLNLEKPKKAFEIEKTEKIAREIAGNNYWISFLANTFSDFDFTVINFDKIFAFMDKQLPDSLLDFKETIHSKQIKMDAKIIKNVIGENLFDSVWEIENPVADKSLKPEIRILNGNSEINIIPKAAEFGGKICNIEALSKQMNVKGCTKTYVQACQRGIGFHNYIMKEWNNPSIQ